MPLSSRQWLSSASKRTYDAAERPGLRPGSFAVFMASARVARPFLFHPARYHVGMFNVGGQEFALIIVLALVVVGPDQLPGLIRKMGHYAAQARQMSSSLRAEFMAATEPMQDTFKEFQEGMNEFQTGMTDLSKTVTDAADVKQWGAGTEDDPIVPRGFADQNSADGPNGDADVVDKRVDEGADTPSATSTSSSAAVPPTVAAAANERPDPWADERIQPITQPERAKKKLEIPEPVNPWADVRDHVDVGGPVAEQSAAAADQLDASIEQALDAEPDEEPA